MRVYMDTEFLERGPTYPIELISIALRAEDGREFYAIDERAPWFHIFEHGWLTKNVVPHLPIVWNNDLGIPKWVPDHADFSAVMRRGQIAAKAEDFLLASEGRAKNAASGVEGIEIWADCGGYDRVVLAQLWGTMVGLPHFIPYWQHDLRSLMALDGISEDWLDERLPELDPEHAHDARFDVGRLEQQVLLALGAADRL